MESNQDCLLEFFLLYLQVYLNVNGLGILDLPVFGDQNQIHDLDVQANVL